jgi:hypothetical protein
LGAPKVSARAFALPFEHRSEVDKITERLSNISDTVKLIEAHEAA